LDAIPVAVATIVARVLDVPLAGRIEGLLLRVETGDEMLVQRGEIW
jgi:hypothetical protein